MYDMWLNPVLSNALRIYVYILDVYIRIYNMYEYILPETRRAKSNIQ